MFNQLNENISQEEIQRAISKLNISKSAGSDNLTREMIIACLILCLKTKCLQIYRLKGIVVPIPKPGDATDPYDYQLIVLVVFSKIYTSILRMKIN